MQPLEAVVQDEGVFPDHGWSDSGGERDQDDHNRRHLKADAITSHTPKIVRQSGLVNPISAWNTRTLAALQNLIAAS